MSPICPICRKPSSPKIRPFCSTRCADIDLGRWFAEQYVLPGTDGEAEADESGDIRSDRLDPSGAVE
jgi:hypothetical protein